MAAMCCLKPLAVHSSNASSCYSVGHKRRYSESEDSEDIDCCSRLYQPAQDCCQSCVSSNRMKIPRHYNSYIGAFLELFEDELIQDFLWIDACSQIADRYLLAMVYVYFRRAHLQIEEYTRLNFFVALYLANDMEEDNEDEKYEIFPWAIGEGWMTKYPTVLVSRDILWRRMGFRAVVSRKTCEEVISQAPQHDIWQRHRLEHHGGALRSYMRPNSPRYGRTSPTFCQQCSQCRDPSEPSPSSPSSYLITWETVPKRDLLDEIDHTYRQQVTISKQTGQPESHQFHNNYTHHLLYEREE